MVVADIWLRGNYSDIPSKADYEQPDREDGVRGWKVKLRSTTRTEQGARNVLQIQEPRGVDKRRN